MAKIDRMSGKSYQEKHAKNLRGATDEISKGVDATTDAPGKKAAEAKDAWVKKMSSSKTQDKWERAVGDYTLEDWKADMKELGIGRISAGLDRSSDKIEKFGDALIDHIKGIKPEFDKRKPLTIDEAANKAADWIKKMGEFQYK